MNNLKPKESNKQLKSQSNLTLIFKLIDYSSRPADSEAIVLKPSAGIAAFLINNLIADKLGFLHKIP